MKKIRISAAVLLFVMLFSTMFTGCSLLNNNSERSPSQAIIDAYGSNEYKITFDTNGAAEPLSDITYTASVMPELPTPERVGYVFEGWYLDKNYTVPYMDGILYLYMKDVVLYAKWTKESMVQDGVYDVETQITVAEETLNAVSGDVTAAYDFLEDIVTDDIQIEKSGSGVLLKFSYDNRTFSLFDGNSTYTVSVSSKMGSSVTVSNRIEALSDTKRTLYLNITDFDMANPIYLRVVAYDWDRENADASEILQTRVTFEAELKITRFIGFSKSYVDPSQPLEEGYYLVKTFYRQSDYSETMMDSYNPVYAYICARADKNGQMNYKLIKPFIPYTGLIGADGTVEENVKKYYNRLAVFTPVQAFCTIYPGGNNSYTTGEYGDFEIEFHADTGRYYYVFDLGNDVNKDILMFNAATGIMEVAFHMGTLNTIMTIDREHMLRMFSVDYTPLEGDSYRYSDEFAFYPLGNGNSVFSADERYEMMKEYGLSTDLVNFYYSAPDDYAADEEKTLYSHKISITPASTRSVEESKNSMSVFRMDASVYGYSRKAGSLYADVMTVNSVSSTQDSGVRQIRMLKPGLTLDLGTEVKIEDIFLQKVDSRGNFADVRVTAYGISRDEPDYTDSKNLSSLFTFSEEVALVFEWDEKASDGGVTGQNRAVVELRKKYEPVVSFGYNGGVFDPEEEKTWRHGESVYSPAVN